MQKVSVLQGMLILGLINFTAKVNLHNLIFLEKIMSPVASSKIERRGDIFVRDKMQLTTLSLLHRQKATEDT